MDKTDVDFSLELKKSSEKSNEISNFPQVKLPKLNETNDQIAVENNEHSSLKTNFSGDRELELNETTLHSFRPGDLVWIRGEKEAMFPGRIAKQQEVDPKILEMKKNNAYLVYCFVDKRYDWNEIQGIVAWESNKDFEKSLSSQVMDQVDKWRSGPQIFPNFQKGQRDSKTTNEFQLTTLRLPEDSKFEVSSPSPPQQQISLNSTTEIELNNEIDSKHKNNTIINASKGESSNKITKPNPIKNVDSSQVSQTSDKGDISKKSNSKVNKKLSQAISDEKSRAGRPKKVKNPEPTIFSHEPVSDFSSSEDDDSCDKRINKHKLMQKLGLIAPHNHEILDELMKLHKDISSSRRKSRKAHFTASSHARRIRMSSALSKDLRGKYGFRSVPIHRGDEVLVVSGSNKDKEGKVTKVYRSRYVIFIDKVTREKANGQTVSIGIHPSNVVVTKLKGSKRRDKLIERRSKAALVKNGEKNTTINANTTTTTTTNTNTTTTDSNATTKMAVD